MVRNRESVARIGSGGFSKWIKLSLKLGGLQAPCVDSYGAINEILRSQGFTGISKHDRSVDNYGIRYR